VHGWGGGGGGEIQVTSLTSALDEDKRSATRSGGFTSGTHILDLRASLDLACNTVTTHHRLSLDMVLQND